MNVSDKPECNCDVDQCLLTTARDQSHILLTLVKKGCRNCRVTTHAMLGVTVIVPRWLGLGDLVKDVIHAVTRIKPCAACERRRQWLNDRFPFAGPLLRRTVAEAHGSVYPLHSYVSYADFIALRKEMIGDKKPC